MNTLLLSVLFAAAPVPAHVIVGGGGTKATDAKEWLERFERARSAPGFADMVALAAGFPRIVDSATVEGLKPGLFVVLLGFCGDAEVDEQVAALRMIDPGVYQRATPTAVASACPKATPFPPREGAASWQSAGGVHAGSDVELQAFKRAEGSHAEVVVRLLAGGKLSDAWRAPATGEAADALSATCSPKIAVGGPGLKVDQSCELGVRGPGAYCSIKSRGAFTLTAGRNGKMEVKKSGASEGKMECGGE